MNGIPKKIKIYVNKKIKNNNFVYSSKSKTKKKQSNFDLYILDNNFDKCFVKIEKMGYEFLILEIDNLIPEKKITLNADLQSFIEYSTNEGLQKGGIIPGRDVVIASVRNKNILIFKNTKLYTELLQNDFIYNGKRLNKFEFGGLYQNKFKETFLCLDVNKKIFLRLYNEKMDFKYQNPSFDISKYKNILESEYKSMVHYNNNHIGWRIIPTTNSYLLQIRKTKPTVYSKIHQFTNFEMKTKFIDLFNQEIILLDIFEAQLDIFLEYDKFNNYWNSTDSKYYRDNFNKRKENIALISEIINSIID